MNGQTGRGMDRWIDRCMDRRMAGGQIDRRMDGHLIGRTTVHNPGHLCVGQKLLASLLVKGTGSLRKNGVNKTLA